MTDTNNIISLPWVIHSYIINILVDAVGLPVVIKSSLNTICKQYSKYISMHRRDTIIRIKERSIQDVYRMLPDPLCALIQSKLHLKIHVPQVNPSLNDNEQLIHMLRMDGIPLEWCKEFFGSVRILYVSWDLNGIDNDQVNRTELVITHLKPLLYQMTGLECLEIYSNNGSVEEIIKDIPIKHYHRIEYFDHNVSIEKVEKIFGLGKDITIQSLDISSFSQWNTTNLHLLLRGLESKPAAIANLESLTLWFDDVEIRDSFMDKLFGILKTKYLQLKKLVLQGSCRTSNYKPFCDYIESTNCKLDTLKLPTEMSSNRIRDLQMIKSISKRKWSKITLPNNLVSSEDPKEQPYLLNIDLLNVYGKCNWGLVSPQSKINKISRYRMNVEELHSLVPILKNNYLVHLYGIFSKLELFRLIVENNQSIRCIQVVLSDGFIEAMEYLSSTVHLHNIASVGIQLVESKISLPLQIGKYKIYDSLLPISRKPTYELI